MAPSLPQPCMCCVESTAYRCAGLDTYLHVVPVPVPIPLRSRFSSPSSTGKDVSRRAASSSLPLPLRVDTRCSRSRALGAHADHLPPSAPLGPISLGRFLMLLDVPAASLLWPKSGKPRKSFSLGDAVTWKTKEGRHHPRRRSVQICTNKHTHASNTTARIPPIRSHNSLISSPTCLPL